MIDNESKKLAFIGVLQSAIITVGAAIMSVGMSVWFIIYPLLNDMIKRGIITDQDVSLLTFLNQNVVFFTLGGGVIVLLGVVGAYRQIFNKKKDHSKFYS